MSGPIEKVLVALPHLRVVHRTAAITASDVVAVTFTTWRPEPSVNLQRGFAEGVFLARGVDEILVMNGRNDWYQAPEVLEAFGRIRHVLEGYRKVISYGASMGAYACLNFSTLLQADICFAMSPQFSVDPQIVPWERRWQGDRARIRFLHDDINGSLSHRTRHILMFDPGGIDARHVGLVEPERIRKVPLRHSGHFTLNTIKDLGMLSDLIACLLRDGTGLDAFAATYHRRIRDSPWRLISVAERCVRHPRRLLMLWHSLRRRPAEDPVIYEKMGLYLLLARRFAEALQALHALPGLGDRPYARALRARVHAGLGQMTAAAMDARRVAELVGTGHDYYQQLQALGIAARDSQGEKTRYGQDLTA